MANQTDQGWIDRFTKTEQVGTGIFLRRVEGKIQKAYQRNVTYQQFLRESVNLIEYKWIPASVAAYEVLIKQSCGGLCKQTCTQPGCLCYDGSCQ